MSLISTTIPNLVNGVSQQPPALRLASQAAEQINGYASVVDGLRKRPGTRHIRRFPTNLPTTMYLHTINRDAAEKYVVVIGGGNLRVFDLQGNEKTVNFPNGKGYLSAANPQDNFRCVTVADYTFVLNNQITVQESADLSPTRPFEALIWVKQGAYGGKYQIWAGGAYATYTVPNGSDASHANAVTTDNIAGNLINQLAAQLGGGWHLVQYGSTIHIHRHDWGTFGISSADSIGDTGINVIAGNVQRFSSLPARAVSGMVVQVSGDQSSSFGSYFVRYDISSTSNNEGVWKETVKPGERIRMNASTLPHGLIREANGTFTFKPLTWADRKCADLENNPFPSFVGRKITDIFFHRNRLGFISDENVVFSRTGDYFNFFRGTATAVLDDDPIDVGVSHVKVSLLRHAVPFNENLLLFSDQTQFRLGDAEVLTPETISIKQATEYECSLRAKPVGIGRHVYFAVNRGKYAGIKEYRFDQRTETMDAIEVTGHVPQYIPGGVFKITASGNEDCLVLLSDQAKNKAYVYKFYWSEEEKLQASWSEWVFDHGAEILNADFIESDLYLIIRRADGVHLERMSIDPGRIESDWNIAVHLDRMVTYGQLQAVVFYENDPTREDDNVTHFLLPYKLPSLDTTGIQVVIAPGGSRTAGQIFEVKSVFHDDAVGCSGLVMSGDWRNQPVYIGIPYTLRYRFSPLSVREDAQGGGQNVIGEGRLQLRRMSLLYAKSGYFRVEVTPFRRDTYRYIFSGRLVGSARNVIGQSAIETGKYSFPIMAKNDQVDIVLINDSYLPSYFMSGEWEGFFILRSRRL